MVHPLYSNSYGLLFVSLSIKLAFQEKGREGVAVRSAFCAYLLDSPSPTSTQTLSIGIGSFAADPCLKSERGEFVFIRPVYLGICLHIECIHDTVLQ